MQKARYLIITTGSTTRGTRFYDWFLVQSFFSEFWGYNADDLLWELTKLLSRSHLMERNINDKFYLAVQLSLCWVRNYPHLWIVPDPSIQAL